MIKGILGAITEAGALVCCMKLDEGCGGITTPVEVWLLFWIEAGCLMSLIIEKGYGAGFSTSVLMVL